MADIDIRPFAKNDYEAARKLFEELDERHRVAVPWLFESPRGEPRPPEYFDQLTASRDAAVFVAVERRTGSVAGLILLAVREPPPSPVFIRQRWGVIDNLVVATEHRRRGIGLRLLRTGEAWLKQAGVGLLDLNVYELNEDARAFYEAAGYLPVSTRMQKPLATSRP